MSNINERLLNIKIKVAKLIERANPTNLISQNATISPGYFSLKWGDVPGIATSSNPHYHFDEYFELESEQVYTIEIPKGITWAFVLLDVNQKYRGGIPMGNIDGFTFVCPPNIKYIAIVTKYIPEGAYEYYMRQIKLYKNQKFVATKINLANVLDDIGNWEHINLAYSQNKTFEDNKASGSNASYIRYNNLIAVDIKSSLLIMNLSEYPTFNFQIYEQTDSGSLARDNIAVTGNSIMYYPNFYSDIALTPKTGTSSIISDVLESYKQWLNIYQISTVGM